MAIYKWGGASRSLLASLPTPDLTMIETQVADEIQRLRGEVEKNPGSDIGWGKLGMILDVHDFNHEAIPCYKQASALNPTEFRWPYYCAIVLLDIASNEAFEWFERSRELRPDYTAQEVHYGRALFEAGKLEEALRAFNHALSMEPTSAQAYVGLGKISLARGELQASRNYLLKGIELNAQYKEAHAVLAEVFRRLGEEEKAARELRAARQLSDITPLADPIYDELVNMGISAVWYRDRGLAFQAQGRLDEAVEELRTALELRPDPSGHNHVGNLFSQLGRYNEALIQYQAAISLAPNHVVAYNNMGGVLVKAGQPKEAIVWFEKSLRFNPELPEPYLNLGTIYIELGRPADAILTLRKGLKRTRGFPPIAVTLAWLLATEPDPELRDGAEAVRLAKAACESSDFKDARALEVLAAAYAESGEFAKAGDLARKAYQLAHSSQRPELANQIEGRLALYAAEKPYRRN